MKRLSHLVAWISALFILLAPAGSARAQTCLGFASYEIAPVQLSASAAFSDDAKSYGGGVSFGGRGFFGGATVGGVNIDDLDATGLFVNVGAGYEVALDSRRTAFLCPAAAVGHLFGPNDIGGSGIDYSETDFAFGVAFGIVASDNQQVQVVPTAALAFNAADWKLEDRFGQDVSDTETFASLDFGLGFVFSRMVSLKPSISIPIGLENGNVSFGLAAGVNFGSGR
jgi:hypothetical protein